MANDEAEPDDTELLDETEFDGVAEELIDNDENEDDTEEELLEDAEFEDTALLEEDPVAEEPLGEDDVEEVPLIVELLGAEDVEELAGEVVKLVVIVDIEVLIKMPELNVANEVPVFKLDITEELNKVELLAADIVPEVLGFDKVLKLVDNVVVSDEVVRLLDLEEDEEEFVEDDEAVLDVIKKLTLLVDVTDDAEPNWLNDADILDEVTELLLKKLESCVIELIVLEGLDVVEIVDIIVGPDIFEGAGVLEEADMLDGKAIPDGVVVLDDTTTIFKVEELIMAVELKELVMLEAL